MDRLLDLEIFHKIFENLIAVTFEPSVAHEIRVVHRVSSDILGRDYCLEISLYHHFSLRYIQNSCPILIGDLKVKIRCVARIISIAEWNTIMLGKVPTRQNS